ncbi:hypothetical protein V8B97DRAFT_1915875 [Scleroderma yunnanense]
MHLIFSTNNYLNTVISDEYRHKLYTVSTSGVFGSKTTVKRHGRLGGSHVIGTIKWHTFRNTKIWLRAANSEVAAKSLLRSKLFSSMSHRSQHPQDKLFGMIDSLDSLALLTVGPQLKAEGSSTRLVKYHKRNLGILSPSHAPYLEVSHSVSHMLDYVVVTFIYAEKLSKKREEESLSAAAG